MREIRASASGYAMTGVFVAEPPAHSRRRDRVWSGLPLEQALGKLAVESLAGLNMPPAV